MEKQTVAAQRGFKSAVTEEEDPFLEDLRGLVWSDERTNHRSWDQLAREAGISYATVRNLAVGETKRPHLRTIHKLLLAMGFRFAVVPGNAPRLRQELDLSKYRKKE